MKVDGGVAEGEARDGSCAPPGARRTSRAAARGEKIEGREFVPLKRTRQSEKGGTGAGRLWCERNCWANVLVTRVSERSERQ